MANGGRDSDNGEGETFFFAGCRRLLVVLVVLVRAVVVQVLVLE